MSTNDPHKNVIFIFGNNKYRLTHLKSRLSGPACTFANFEINDLLLEVGGNYSADLSVEVIPPSASLDNLPVSFYKHHGRWLVLTGKNHVEEAKKDGMSIVEGVVISGPALKSCRVSEEELAGPPRTSTYPSSYANRPRFPHTSVANKPHVPVSEQHSHYTGEVKRKAD